MMVYIVEVCTCDEYGCMEFAGVFSTEQKAHEWAAANGLQCKDKGERYNARLDYYEVRVVEMDAPEVFEPY